MSHIAFIGLGNMGGPMVSNLLKHGQSVCVFDLVQDAMAHCTRLGARQAKTASEAAKDASVVISMLPAATHVQELYLGESGLLASIEPDTLVIDCSTIDAETARAVAWEANLKGCPFVDAPVSGGVGGAKAGTLTFIMGGDESAVALARPVLQNMGVNLFHAGPVGAGQIAKICNNLLLAVLMAGTSEALQLAIHHGLDPKVVSEIMRNSSGGNWTLEKYNPCPGVMDNVPAANDYQGGFLVRLMNKDLDLALAAASETGSATPMAAAAQSLFRVHQNHGNGHRDFSSIFELFAKS
ncbi:3-hydroxyisobutyrate dehydrogenase [Alteromonas aestuariivivens]|uniref:3-hydroxyisobutyrate dehydrogenase n=1 Tax=Alteromonas aestuariivivens TaxID=1938339 RepID=A0A3D8M8M2_9ALTE|nr:3-hydroxyisobutyrate dehydrogenase [Alteromonas aestuariivivens]RDV26028.1 3-hydroxyisobutyrate dehydrogenase [Alteromonas aestuariivivens]